MIPFPLVDHCQKILSELVRLRELGTGHSTSCHSSFCETTCRESRRNHCSRWKRCDHQENTREKHLVDPIKVVSHCSGNRETVLREETGENRDYGKRKKGMSGTLAMFSCRAHSIIAASTGRDD